MTPRPKIPSRHTTPRLIIIARKSIKKRHLLDIPARRIFRNPTDVQNSQTRLVIRLIREAVVDELVVVDGLDGGFVVAGLFGMFEVFDGPDVGDGETVGGGTRVGAVGVDDAFVDFVVHEEVGLPLWVEDPALVLWMKLLDGGWEERERGLLTVYVAPTYVVREMMLAA